MNERPIARFHDLPSFLRVLEKMGELKRVKIEVSPILEITEIVTRVLQSKGPAILFERVKGSPYPLVINLFGTERRVEIILRRHPQAIGEDFVHLLEQMNPPTPRKIFSLLPFARRLLAMRPHLQRKSRVYEVVEEPNLWTLPAIQCWPKDGGRFITFPLVITHHPVKNTRNVGTYRMQIYTEKTAGMHWHIHKGGAKHYFEAERLGKDLPVAVAIGGDPVLAFSAIAPLPEEVDEIAFAGFLRGSPIPLTRARTLPWAVPAEAEFILEGIVPCGERRMEGPFGDHFGHYSAPALFPVFHIHFFARRSHPIYHTIFVGKPPQEDAPIGHAIEHIFNPLVKILFPEIVDMWAYMEAGFHNLLVVAVEERYPRHAVKTMFSILGFGQLSLTKTVILVSKGVNPRDFQAVLQEIRQNFDPAIDFYLIPNTILDTLDFTGKEQHIGSKMVLIACRKGQPLISPVSPHPVSPVGKIPGVTNYRLISDCLLILQVNQPGKFILQQSLQLPDYKDVKIIATVSEDVDLQSDTEYIWGIFTRFDPQKDVFFERTKMENATPHYEGRLCIDATWKANYPEPLKMPEDIRKLVDQKWDAYWKGE